MTSQANTGSSFSQVRLSFRVLLEMNIFIISAMSGRIIEMRVQLCFERKINTSLLISVSDALPDLPVSTYITDLFFLVLHLVSLRCFCARKRSDTSKPQHVW